jgi:hypothetical protein
MRSVPVLDLTHRTDARLLHVRRNPGEQGAGVRGVAIYPVMRQRKRPE